MSISFEKLPTVFDLYSSVHDAIMDQYGPSLTVMMQSWISVILV